jgi:hypothetical protein
MSRTALLALSALLLAGSAAACRSASPYDVNQEGAGVVVVVRNQNFSDVDVYAIASGLPSRLGTVAGNSTQSFKLSESFVSSTSDFRLVATPIGGNGRASSGPLPVSSGRTVTFTIGARLAQSSASVQ